MRINEEGDVVLRRAEYDFLIDLADAYFDMLEAIMRRSEEEDEPDQEQDQSPAATGG